MYVDLIADDPEGWEIAAQQADKVVLCGNPRFNRTESKVYWDWDIWRRIAESGIPFIDAWAGSACPFSEYSTPEEMATKLLAVAKNRRVLQYEAKAERIIARDKTTELLCKTVNPNTVLLPCSSQYARLEYRVEPEAKQYHAIVVREMPGNEWILAKAQRLKDRLKNCFIVAHSYDAWKWASSLSPICISDPLELLRFYARVDELHSFALHASIPALSLGARVTHYAIDSRADILKPFGLASMPFTQFGSTE